MQETHSNIYTVNVSIVVSGDNMSSVIGGVEDNLRNIRNNSLINYEINSVEEND